MRKPERLAAALVALVLVSAGGASARAADGDNTDPHAHAAGSGAMPGVFEPPEDTEAADPALPPGTVVVDLADADGKPVAGDMVTLGILINSIAKGDSRKHLQGTTDDHGRVTFSGLETASGVAYRVSSGYQGGAFAASPFQLEHAKAMHVVLHVYPVTRDVQRTLLITEATVAAEVRDDRLQMEEVLTFYNLGRTAWQPDNVRLALPAGFTALNAQASMTDQGVDADGNAARLRGTFSPGRHAVDFRWQLPLSGDKDIDFDVGLPPHIAIARVVMPVSTEIKLTAAGFPPGEIRRDPRGQRFVVVERRLRPEDPKLTSMSIGIRDLPTPGPARWIATMLAGCAVAAGLALSLRRPDRLGPSDARAALLEEAEALERARASGDVGPKTYEKVRADLVDALARTLAQG